MMGVPIGTYVQNMVDGEFVSHDFIVSGAVEIKKLIKLLMMHLNIKMKVFMIMM